MRFSLLPLLTIGLAATALYGCCSRAKCAFPSPSLVIDFSQSALSVNDTVGLVAVDTQTGAAEYKGQYNISYQDTTLTLPLSTLQSLLPDMSRSSLVLLTKDNRADTISQIKGTLVSKVVSCNKCFLSGSSEQVIAYENLSLIYQGQAQQHWQVLFQ